jgi:hypothetical protein
MSGDKDNAAGDDRADTYREFQDTVNMTATELDDWLQSDDSRDVGQKSGGHESTGHASGRRIIEILRTKKADLDEDDYAHMRKVVGYAKRHLAQRPSGDVTDTKWRYSLMNWGHDPAKKSS